MRWCSMPTGGVDGSSRAPGVASAWTLELPRAVNEIDYASLVDVRLTFTYEARFDPALEERVLAELATRPGVNERQRPVPLRWLFPDAFFSFYGSGVLDVTLGVDLFAAIEDAPTLTELSLIVVTSPRAPRRWSRARCDRPGSGPDRSHERLGRHRVDRTAGRGTRAPRAIGEYRIVLDPAANPSWVVNGELDIEGIQNIALALGYSFSPPT